MIPVLHLGGQIYLPTWILILSLTLSLALIWVNGRAQKWGLSRSQSLDLSLAMMVGAVIGGRALHVIYEEPAYYLLHPLAIFKFWEGGFVFYGGLFGALASGWTWCRKHDQSFWRWGDFFAPILAACYAAGRVGCFLNGCCYGKACALPWAVVFSHHGEIGIPVFPRHPTQLYATFWELGVLLFLLNREKRIRPDGHQFLLWLALHALGRFVMELLRDDDRGFMLGGLSLGMVISVVVFATAAMGLLRQRTSSQN